jgi:ribose transport system permease protein
VTKGLVAPFVATLGGLVAYRSLAVYLADGSEARFIGEDGTAAPMTTLANTGIGIPGTNVAPRAPEPIELLINWPILGFLALAIVAAVVLNRTRFGRHLVAVGANERAARYTGLAVDRIKIAAFAIVGVTAGLAGLLFASRTGAIGSGSTGTLLELDAIAAVVIGVLLLGVIATMLPLLNVDTKLQGLVTGVIIVLAVMLQRGR